MMIRCVVFVFCVVTQVTAVGTKDFEPFLPKTCVSSTNDFLKTVTSYRNCLKHCKIRSSCMAVSYSKRLSACRMNDQLIIPGDCQGYVYSLKRNWNNETGSSHCNCNPRTQCDNNGNCIPSECVKLQHPKNGRRLGNVFSIGGKALFRCNNGYLLEGSRQRDCQVNGTWSGQVVSCVEDPACVNYLVSGSDGVDDDQLSESSYYCNVHSCPLSPGPTVTSAQCARLHATGIYTGAWVAASKSQDEFVQVDFRIQKTFSGIALQGRYHNVGPIFTIINYVTQFRVLHSLDCVQFTVVPDESGADKIFEGNSNGVDIVVRYLLDRVRARCVRINPVAWFKMVALRFDVLGC